MEEAYAFAQKRAIREANVAIRKVLSKQQVLGMVAGLSVAVGVAGAMGQVLMFQTALPPVTGEREQESLFGFNAATHGKYQAPKPGQSR